jgi:hypothetical protein
MADYALTNRAFAITVPGGGKTVINTTEWVSFANSGTQVLVIDTPGGDLGVSILLPSGMWPIRANAIYSLVRLDTMQGIVGHILEADTETGSAQMRVRGADKIENGIVVPTFDTVTYHFGPGSIAIVGRR